MSGDEELAKKPQRSEEYREITYVQARWDLLQRLRGKAIGIMEALDKASLPSTVHGSIARGDVTEKSDIDIFIHAQPSSFAVETALERAGLPVNRRLVMQATPAYAMKAHVEIDPSTTVTFPLMKMRRVEREFYRFGGEAALNGLRKGERIAGVDKRLMLIEPTPDGHHESTVVGREEHVAKLLGISAETVLDRVHTLLKRDNVGRTGVFVKEELTPEETFEIMLRRLAGKNPAVRRRLRSIH